MEFGQPPEGETSISVLLDKEKEKKHRGEIRKALERAINNQLKENGFRRSGKSTWLKDSETNIEIIYLQRSQYRHSYYIEAGIYRGDTVFKDTPPTITDCRHNDRERLEYILRDIYRKEHEGEPDVEERAEAARIRLDQALNFEMTNDQTSHSNVEYPPSVPLQEATKKIQIITEATRNALPLWLEQHSSLTDNA